MFIAPINLGNTYSQGFTTHPQMGIGTSGDRPQTLDAALDALIKSMTSDQGKVNGDNPLVKLLGDYLRQSGSGGSQGAGPNVQDMSADQLKNALSDMLERILGSAARGNGLGGGGEDVLSSLLGGLAQHRLTNMLQPSGDGGATFSLEDKDLMKEVGQFMDQHPETFGSPDNANGTTRSWSDEAGEDNTLNGAEAGAVQQAIQMIAHSAGNGSASAAGTLANSDVPLSADRGGEFRGSGASSRGLGDALAHSDLGITMSADEFLKLMQTLQGEGSQRGGDTAQGQALSQDASQAAGSIISKMFSG